MSKPEVDYAELEVIRLPARTRLYSLEPIGVGTGWVESLTGYLARLATAHCVPTSALLCKEIVPNLRGISLATRNRYAELFGGIGVSLNGNNNTGRTMIRTVESLTGRQEIERMTMQFCGTTITHKGMLRDHQAWCPDCLSDKQKNGLPIYNPLLWSLATVTICEVHKMPLQELCPNCKKKHRPLDWRSRPGYCSKCQHWLGSNFESLRKSGSANELNKWDFYSSEQTRYFIEQGPPLIGRASGFCFGKNLNFILAAKFEGITQGLANVLQQTRGTIRDWIAGKQNPKLGSILQVSYTLGLNVIEMCCQNLETFDPRRIQSNPPTSVLQQNKRHSKRYDRAKIEIALDDYIACNEVPSPSLAKIAKKFGCHQTYLARNFPTQVALLKERHTASINRAKAERRAFIHQIVRRVTMDLHEDGIYPSAQIVRELVPSIADLRDPDAQAAWKATLVELGLGAESKV